MKSEPHPTLPGVFVTTPLYVGTMIELRRMQTCQHAWPEGMPEDLNVSDEGEVGVQHCTWGCGATRAIYRVKKEAPNAPKTE